MANLVSPQASQFLPEATSNESLKMPTAGNSQVLLSGSSVIPGTLTNGPPVPPYTTSMTGVQHGPYGARPLMSGGPPLASKFTSHKDGNQYQGAANSPQSVEGFIHTPSVPNSYNTNAGNEHGRPPQGHPYGVPQTIGPPFTNGPNQLPGESFHHTATNGLVSGTSTHSSNFPVGPPFIRQGPPVSSGSHMTHPGLTSSSYGSSGFPHGPRAPNRNMAEWNRQSANSFNVAQANDSWPITSSTGSSVAASPATSGSSDHLLPPSSSTSMSSQAPLKESSSHSWSQTGSHQLPQSIPLAAPQPNLKPVAGPTSLPSQPPNSYQTTQLRAPQYPPHQPQPLQQQQQPNAPGIPPISSIRPPPPPNRFPPPPPSTLTRFPSPPQQSSSVPTGVPPTLQQGPPYSQPIVQAASAVPPPPPSGPMPQYGASALPHGQRPYQYPSMGSGVQPLAASQGVHSTVNPGVDHTRWQKPQQMEPAGVQQFAPGKPPPGSTFLPSSNGVDQLGNLMAPLSLHGREQIDLLQVRHILPDVAVEPPKVVLPSYDPKTSNCSPEIFRCTLTKIPESQSVLQKSRLPLGILIHPFKDLIQLPVVQCSVIVRCRTCRTYINPFVQFLDQHRWKCNLCFRVNELHEEFQYDPISKTYGDPTRRPEIKSATIEFIAPSEYMLRPPQPAVYLFILDVSYSAIETGYLRCFCETLLEELEKLPGDSRTRVGFMTFDNSLHFYNLDEGLSQPQMMIVSDIDDVFLPCPDNLLVNLNENMELVKDLLEQLPIQFMESKTPDSALGAALQAAFKLVSPTGGRITVVQGSLPNVGPGALKAREDPNLRAGKEVHNLGPANDFYKKLSLDCSGHQVSVDLFIISSQYCDIATLSCISKFSGGSTHYYPGFHAQLNSSLTNKFEHDLRRYFTRKIGFEAVMRIRCTKGLSIHTFHGNFFVRSTDLLSLPNINPDAGFGMQMSIEEPLVDSSTACFQAALLYTSSKGERRIRVHTLCLPVTTSVSDIIYSADQQAIVGLLTKMAVDRSLSSSMSDARDALINACVDALSAYRLISGSSHGGVLVSASIKLIPLYILAILKHIAFRLGTSTKLDERVFAMNQMKTLPLTYLMTYIYPNMYAVHNLETTVNFITVNEIRIPQPPVLNLSAEKFERQGVFLLDSGDHMFLYVCQGVRDQYCQNVLNAKNFDAIPERMTGLPEVERVESECLRNFVNHLQSQRPFHATFQVLKNTSKNKTEFLQYLVEDRSESAYSYYEFLKHIQQLMSK